MSFNTVLKESKHFVSMTIGASKEEILNAEKTLNLRFSKEFILYTSEFGSASIRNHEFIGVVKSPRLDVVTQTLIEREKDPTLPTDLYVVERFDIYNIVLLQNSNGEIYSHVPNDKQIKISNSLEEYLVSMANKK